MQRELASDPGRCRPWSLEVAPDQSDHQEVRELADQVLPLLLPEPRHPRSCSPGFSRRPYLIRPSNSPNKPVVAARRSPRPPRGDPASSYTLNCRTGLGRCWKKHSTRTRLSPTDSAPGWASRTLISSRASLRVPSEALVLPVQVPSGSPSKRSNHESSTTTPPSIDCSEAVSTAARTGDRPPASPRTARCRRVSSCQRGRRCRCGSSTGHRPGAGRAPATGRSPRDVVRASTAAD